MKTEAPQDEEELFEVEGIVDMRTTKNGKIQYRVRWANYSPSNDTWEPEENLESCVDFIENFLASKKAVQINTVKNPSPQKQVVSPCPSKPAVQSCSKSNNFDQSPTLSTDAIENSPSSGSKRRRTRASEVSKLMQCSIFKVIDKDELSAAAGDAIYQRVKRKRTEYLDESALSSSASDNDKNSKDGDKLIDEQLTSNSSSEQCAVEDLPLSNIFEMSGSSFRDNTQNDENNEKTSSSENAVNLHVNDDNNATEVVNVMQKNSIDQELHQLDNLLKSVSALSSKRRNSKSSIASVNVDLIDLVIDSVIKRVIHGDINNDDTNSRDETNISKADGVAVDHKHISPHTAAEVPTVKQEVPECLTVLQTSFESVGEVESVIREPHQIYQNEKIADGRAAVETSSKGSRINCDSMKVNPNSVSGDHSKVTLASDLRTKIEPENSVMTSETNDHSSVSPEIPAILNDKNFEVPEVEMGTISEPRNQSPPLVGSPQKQQQQQTPPRVLKPLFSGLWLPLTKAKNQNAVAAVDEQPPAETRILSLERINDENNNKESSESPQLPSIPEEEAAPSVPPTVEVSNVSVAVASSSKKAASLEDMFDRKLNLNDYFKSLMHKSQNFDRTKTHIVTQTDLFESCRLGHFDLVRSALLAAKNSKIASAYNLNALDEYGRTILMNLVLTKCDSCHIIDDIMELLVQNGANLNLRSREGDTALMMAIQSEYLCKVSKLLSLGAAANLPNHAGETPLYMACSKGLNLFVTKLLESGADFNAVGASGAPLSSLIFNKSINKLIQTHEKRVKSAFDQTLQSILDLDKLKIRLPLFPLHCYSLNESRIFRIIFPHQKLPDVMRTSRDHEILVIGLSKFGTQSICVRLWGLSPVVNVLLNGQELKCAQDDWRFIYKLNCLKNGTNELTIKCADDFRMSKCKLLIQAFVLLRR